MIYFDYLTIYFDLFINYHLLIISLINNLSLFSFHRVTLTPRDKSERVGKIAIFSLVWTLELPKWSKWPFEYFCQMFYRYKTVYFWRLEWSFTKYINKSLCILLYHKDFLFHLFQRFWWKFYALIVANFSVNYNTGKTNNKFTTSR